MPEEKKRRWPEPPDPRELLPPPPWEVLPPPWEARERRQEVRGAYPVTHLSREDIREVFKDSPEMLRRVDRLTDEQMRRIASKLADDYVGQLYWSSLRIIAEDFLKGAD